MTIHERFANAVTRVATATSVRRTRTEDAVRDESHGDSAELLERIQATSTSLEKTAQRILEG